jgi:Tol biopolymer transport system component
MRLRHVACFLLAAALFAGAQGQGDGEKRLQAAIHKEVVQGDLKAAIDLYKEIAANNGGDRNVTAKALLHLAGCYQKLGREEARKTYEELITDYPDQQEEVKLARTRLAALAPNAAERAGIVTRQVWSGADVSLDVAVSPDGRYLAFQDNETSDLALRDLSSGESRRLTRKQGGRENWHEYALFPVFSPDGKQVAFGWGAHESCELRVVGIDGSGLRLLDPGTEHGVFPMDWSRDGRSILALLLNGRQVATVSVADGSVRVLKTIDWPWSVPGTTNPDVMRFSPDGRFIVYDRPADRAGNRDVYMFSVATGEDIPLVQHPAQDRMLGWTPDGKSLLFLSDRTGSWGTWLIDVAGGKPQGVPRLVKRDMGAIRTVGFARNGSFYYRTYDSGNNVYTATIGNGTPSLLSERYLGKNRGASWSPDGKSIAYLSARRPPERVLVIRSIETGEEREYSLPALPIIRNPQWFPDGRSVLLNGVNPQSRTGGWYLVGLEKGQVTPALVGQTDEYGWAAEPLSADGRALYYVQPRDRQTKRPARVMRRDLATGRDEEIRVLPAGVEWGTQLFTSPDGRSLALVRMSAGGDEWDFVLLPLGGGELRVLPGPWTDVKPWKLTWSPDSRHLMFFRPGGEGDRPTRSELWAVSVESGEQHSLGFSVPQNVFHVSVHPDGKQLAFTTQEETTEIWVMDGFLSEPAVARRQDR